MSFSTDLKNELQVIMPKNVHCRYAELAGVISISGRMMQISGEDMFAIRVDSDAMEELVLKLIRMSTDIPDSVITRENEKQHHRKVIIPGKYYDELTVRLKLQAQDSRICVNEIITERNCCKRSFLRGAFLAGGSVSSPEKSYHMEISVPTGSEAEKLCGIMTGLHQSAKLIKRKDRYVLYVKDGDTISDTIGAMGASNSVMEFENIRILKDIRNNINRAVNCDTANMAKTANAAVKQIDDINYVISKVGIDSLPDPLRDMAKVRLEYPYLSLSELGEKFTPTLGKSGISHRLKKLSQMAESLRNE